jgi:hypothetical protein
MDLPKYANITTINATPKTDTEIVIVRRSEPRHSQTIPINND